MFRVDDYPPWGTDLPFSKRIAPHSIEFKVVGAYRVHLGVASMHVGKHLPDTAVLIGVYVIPRVRSRGSGLALEVEVQYFNALP